MWENEAKEVITKLISDILKECGKGITSIPVEIRLTRDDNVQRQLQLAVTNFTHATQYYLQVKRNEIRAYALYECHKKSCILLPG